MIGKPWIALSRGFKPYVNTKLDNWLIDHHLGMIVDHKVKKYFKKQEEELSKYQETKNNLIRTGWGGN